MNTALLEKYEVQPFANPAETEYFIKYLEQGERKGLEGLANVVYARTSTSELFKTLPHLKTKYETEPVPKALKAIKPKVVKVEKSVGTKVAKAPKAKVQIFGDGAVYFRPDRNKWMAVYNGKAEAARPTSQAALAYLKKKYDVDGYVVEQLS
jgi:hypothetical protein